jgi:hypothetical protein
MKIVDRYLESVKNCLSAAQADDIIKELSENISSQIEDKEGELNRPLTETEIEAFSSSMAIPSWLPAVTARSSAASPSAARLSARLCFPSTFEY